MWSEAEETQEREVAVLGETKETEEGGNSKDSSGEDEWGR